VRAGSAPSAGFWKRLGRGIARTFGFGRGRRAYEGASRGRRMQGWDPKNTTANAELYASLQILRARSRDCVRNDPNGARIISVRSQAICGAAGLNVIPDSGSDTLDALAAALWDRWIKRCDVSGVFGLHSNLKLAARELDEAGEVLIRKRPMPTSKGLEVPLRIEVIEADQLDFLKNEQRTDGSRIQHGVECDKRGEVVAYWILPNHPGNATGFPAVFAAIEPSVRVDASEVIHLFERLRAGQIRGVPRMAPVLTKLRDHGDHDQASRLRRKLEACLMAFITPSDQFLEANAEQYNELSPDDPARQNQQPRAVNSDGAVLEDLQPGMVAMLPNGKMITFHTPQATPGFVEESDKQLRDVGVGVDVPYEHLTGDLSRVNYSSFRAGLIPFRGVIESLQWELMIPVCCERIWEWFVEAAWAVSKLPEPTMKGDWTTARWMSVDPMKDAEAAKLKVDEGFVLQEDVIAEEGYHPATMVAKRAAFDKLLVKHGLKAPTPTGDDVQKTALNGAQVDALKALASDAAAGLIPVATAKQIALAAFPIDQAAADAIFDPLDSFTPASAEERSRLVGRVVDAVVIGRGWFRPPAEPGSLQARQAA
jgi:lambda family phage portal protein